MGCMEPLEQDIERKLSVVLERAVMTPPQDAVRWATVVRELTEALVMLRQQRQLEDMEGQAFATTAEARSMEGLEADA